MIYNFNCKLYIKLFSFIYLGYFFIFLYNNKSIYLTEKFDSISIAFEKSKTFIQNCTSLDLFKYKNPILSEPPIVSLIIPMFNCENFILRAVKSAQYQNISNIEILLVDDKSMDNTIYIAEKIRKKDKRIKIIKNQNNRGVLYSRSIGVLSSKGKFIFTLDNDDIFLNNDIFYKMTEIGNKGNFDIIEFKAISNKILNDDLLNNTIEDSEYSLKKSIILFQPKLGRFPIPSQKITGNYELQDIFLWGKCFKSTIYKEALKKLGYNRYSRFMICYEDILINYIIFNIAESFIFIEKYGIYHVIRNGSGDYFGKTKVARSTNILYLIDSIIEFSKNNIINKKLEGDLFIYLFKLRGMRSNFQFIRDNNELIISCIKRILNSKYISIKYKTKIKKISKELKLKIF